MATNKIERGPTAQRVAANVKTVREARRLSLEALSQRMGELGRPILRTGLAKIESGERRVDVDDLIALAIALQVTPNRLLLSSPVEHQLVELTATISWRDIDAWQWASGDGRVIPEPDSAAWEPLNLHAFTSENRPHQPPVLLPPDEWRRLAPFEKRFEDLRADVEAAGLDIRALTDAPVFEECSAEQPHTDDFKHGDES